MSLLEPPLSPTELARPVSLVLTPTRSTFTIPTVLDTTSYSPFPTFPGSSHTHDPFGLNAFLLHPADALWDYMEPKPAATENGAPAAAEPVVQPGLDVLQDDRGRSLDRPKSLILKASSAFRRPSPLAAQDGGNVAEQIDEPPKARRKSASRHSLRRVIQARKVSDAVPAVPDLPKDAVDSESVSASASRGLVLPEPPAEPDEPEPVAGPSTPMSTRSHSAESSASSDDGLRTPADEPAESVRLNLADVLEDAEAKRSKSGWRSWLGGKRGSQLTPASSADSTPSASTAPSPSASTTSLAPSPAITPVSRALPPDAMRQRAAARVRQMSFGKLTAIRGPSPHPLALLLARQHVNLPEEVACSIPAGHCVYPRSVNTHRPLSENSLPRASLRASIGIHAVIAQVDRGCWPETLPRPRMPSRQATVPRPRGVRDFVGRAPFEERNVVFFANDTFSPISMARPGNAVWDLDFSPYIVALAEAEAGRRWSASAGPAPRISLMSDMDGLEVLGAKGDMEKSPLEDAVDALNMLTAKAEIRVVPPSPSLPAGSLGADESETLRDASTGPATRSRPLSSFRRRASSTWDSSDSEDEPLAKLAVRRQPSAPALKTRAQADSAPRARTTSQPEHKPADRRRSRLLDAEDALLVVAKARERRSAFLSGAIDKQVEGERRREENRKSQAALVPPKTLAKRRSTPNLDTVHENDTAAPPLPAQRRSASTVDVAGLPATSRTSTPTGTRSSASSRVATPPRPAVARSAPSSPSVNRPRAKSSSSPKPRRVQSAYDAGSVPHATGLPRMASFYGAPHMAFPSAAPAHAGVPLVHAAYMAAVPQHYAYSAYGHAHAAYAYAHPAMAAFPGQRAALTPAQPAGRERRIA